MGKVGRKENLYNLYLNGYMIATGITGDEVMDLVGCTKNILMLYISREALYHAAEGDYRFEVIGSISNKTDRSLQMRVEFKEDWEKACKKAKKVLSNPAAIRRFRARRIIL